MAESKKMAKTKARGEGNPQADVCLPDSLLTPKIEMDTAVLTPELVKLRYDLLVRRGKAWGVGIPATPKRAVWGS